MSASVYSNGLQVRANGLHSGHCRADSRLDGPWSRNTVRLEGPRNKRLPFQAALSQALYAIQSAVAELLCRLLLPGSAPLPCRTCESPHSCSPSWPRKNNRRRRELCSGPVCRRQVLWLFRRCRRTANRSAPIWNDNGNIKSNNELLNHTYYMK